MKLVYPVFIKKDTDDYLVYAPDINSFTSGKDLYEALTMARDLFGTFSLEYTVMPSPSDYPHALHLTKENADDSQFTFSNGNIYYIDIDTDEYRKRYDNKAIKKNCTLPAWLCYRAEEAGINFSKTLQDALMQKLGINENKH